jgi:hypothetical protein
MTPTDEQRNDPAAKHTGGTSDKNVHISASKKKNDRWTRSRSSRGPWCAPVTSLRQLDRRGHYLSRSGDGWWLLRQQHGEIGTRPSV